MTTFITLTTALGIFLLAALMQAGTGGGAQPLTGSWVQVTAQAAFNPRDTSED